MGGITRALCRYLKLFVCYFPPDANIPVLIELGKGEDDEEGPVDILLTAVDAATKQPLEPNCCNAPTIPATLIALDIADVASCELRV